MKELKIQESLKKLLQLQYTQQSNVFIYQGKEIKNKIGRKHKRVPDLIIEHPFTFHNRSYKKDVLVSPIGIEVKGEDCKIGQMARGMVDQLKNSYQFETYKINNKEMKTNSSLFTTPELIRTGYFSTDYENDYHKHELYVIKRFAWAFNVGLILKNPYQNEYLFSYHNNLYDLFGNLKIPDTNFDPIIIKQDKW